jgi:hypothetical protein
MRAIEEVSKIEIQAQDLGVDVRWRERYAHHRNTLDILQAAFRAMDDALGYQGDEAQMSEVIAAEEQIRKGG